jgi:DNA-binding MarR family transcriptional regulator
MEKGIISLVEEANAINSKIISVPRLLILISLENLGLDGAAYRELKAALDMEDGILYSNLKALEEMGYLEEASIRLENKEMASYHITGEGKEALNSVRAWLGKLAKRVE